MKKDKLISVSKVGEKGQIVIPKDIREMFEIHPGDLMIFLCDKKKGIALVKSEVVEDAISDVLPKGDK